jgi:hypothetical protein
MGISMFLEQAVDNLVEEMEGQPTSSEEELPDSDSEECDLSQLFSRGVNNPQAAIRM